MPAKRIARAMTKSNKTGWKKRADPLVGSTVSAVRPMTEAELADQGWVADEGGPWPTCIEFSNGTILAASQDPADRGDYRPGTLLGVDGDGGKFQIRSIVVDEQQKFRQGNKDNYIAAGAAHSVGRNGRVDRKPVDSDNAN